MTNLFTDQFNKNEEFTKDFIKWYKYQSNLMPIKSFVELPTLNQLPIFELYFVDSFNIGIHYDPYTYMLYWVDPFKPIAYKDIELRSKARGRVTNIILHRVDQHKLDFEGAYTRAVLSVIEYIVNPF